MKKKKTVNKKPIKKKTVSKRKTRKVRFPRQSVLKKAYALMLEGKVLSLKGEEVLGRMAHLDETDAFSMSTTNQSLGILTESALEDISQGFVVMSNDEPLMYVDSNGKESWVSRSKASAIGRPELPDPAPVLIDDEVESKNWFDYDTMYFYAIKNYRIGCQPLFMGVSRSDPEIKGFAFYVYRMKNGELKQSSNIKGFELEGKLHGMYLSGAAASDLVGVVAMYDRWYDKGEV